MTRRELYALVESIAARGFDSRRLLRSTVLAMKHVRSGGAVDALARELLQDVAFARHLAADDALAQVYQAANAPKLESAYRSARRERRKFRPDEIAPVTQLFTPPWVVGFLVRNTLGKLWLQMHPDSALRTPIAAVSADVPHAIDRRRAIEIRVLDPACGTMNFGLAVIDLLRAMYEEELDKAGRRGWPAEPSVSSPAQIPAAIARHNLFGADIDPFAIELARHSIEVKLGAAPENLLVADALFNPPLDRGDFDVVVTNPPFLSSRNLPEVYVRRLKQRFPTCWRDAGVCFVERSARLLRAGGRAGMLVMQSFMFTGAFERFRSMLAGMTAIESIAHFGPGVFDVGNPGTLQTAGIVLRREVDASARARQRVVAFDLTESQDKPAALRAGSNRHEIEQASLINSSRGAWVYWIDPHLQRVFRTCCKLGEVAPPRQGLATTDNARFVRYWWELSKHEHAAGWVPYAKSGRFRRWYEAPRHRVNWANDGAQIKASIVERYPYLDGNWSWVAKNSAYYGRSGVTYSYLTSGRFSARLLPAGAIFDVAGSSLFPPDPLPLLAVLNSSSAGRLLKAINPTVNFQVGDLAQLPVPSTFPPEIRSDVQRLVELFRSLDQFDQTTTDFVAPMPWESAEGTHNDLWNEISEIEARVDGAVADLYGITTSSAATRERFNPDELARRWLNHILMQLLEERGAAQVLPMDQRFVRRVRELLPAGALNILPDIEEFLASGFFDWHARMFQRRPVLWLLGSGQRRHLVYHAHADAVVARLPDAPHGWRRCIADGVVVNLAPLHAVVPSKTFSRRLRDVQIEMEAGRYAWSATAQRMLSRAASCESASARRRPQRPARARAALAAHT